MLFQQYPAYHDLKPKISDINLSLLKQMAHSLSRSQKVFEHSKFCQHLLGIIIQLIDQQQFMSSDLRESLLLRRPTRSRRSMRSLVEAQQPQPIRAIYTPVNEEIQQQGPVAGGQLEWESSSESTILIESPLRPPPRESLKFNYWNDSGAQIKQKTLNDKVFNLSRGVQRRLYWFNMVMNTLTRLCFVNLLVFLALEQKRFYLYLFLSLELTAVLLYFIIMVKMLFTRSDKQSVYFQKIFNETDWADIEAQRVMRSHFGLWKILSKIRIFFNPCTKFEKDTKISFLRQEIFKRIQLVLVIFPFTALFLIYKKDFVTPEYPNFASWITGGIALEVLRTVLTYLTIFVYN